MHDYVSKTLNTFNALLTDGLETVSSELPFKNEAQLQVKYNTTKDRMKADLNKAVAPLAAAGDETKKICEDAWT